MQKFTKLDAQDQPLPDDAPFELVGGILVKAANIILAPFELTGRKGPRFAQAQKPAVGFSQAPRPLLDLQGEVFAGRRRTWQIGSGLQGI